ncbi:hypothetical protein EZL74_12475 [Flavobacterium silvisoli]|uniref:Uncharacterized protein n=1 Tax=Flavobacterium silvisoli TaxID=2529433 RepID=A0A4Q9YTH0_9FLAO|nr:hypothetical protein [Flavobacterium silvisoli]TBX65200.1 hypothetical protein EZL74_12475 [Flavobacterium silvisoli]
MEISKNIFFEKNILNQEDKNIHSKQIEITSLNLDDFNARLNSNIVLVYNSDYRGFFLNSEDERYGRLFTRHIAHLLTYYNHRETWNETSFISYDLNLIKYDFEDLYLSIKNLNQNYTHNLELVRRLNLFKNRWNNYYPLGILSKEGEQQYKNELQKMVDKLNKLIDSLNI